MVYYIGRRRRRMNMVSRDLPWLLLPLCTPVTLRYWRVVCCGRGGSSARPSDGRYMCVVRVVRAPACLRWVDADGWHWQWLAAAAAPKRCILLP